MKFDSKTEKLFWDFELEYLHKNLSFNKADSIGYWAEKHGMWVGKVMFLFNEYSRYVHLNTNTMAMLKVCAKCEGFG